MARGARTAPRSTGLKESEEKMTDLLLKRSRIALNEVYDVVCEGRIVGRIMLTGVPASYWSWTLGIASTKAALPRAATRLRSKPRYRRARHRCPRSLRTRPRGGRSLKAEKRSARLFFSPFCRTPPSADVASCIQK